MEFWGNSYSFFDPDALSYISAVEAADAQTLEDGVRAAYNAFIVGCKADPSPVAGISNFQAIKASCIMAGARTLAGALVPLKGTAPTNFNFVAGDYNRKTGLVGDRVSGVKYLNTNRNNNADPQNSQHLAAYGATISQGTMMGAGVGDTGTSGLGQRAVSGQLNAAVIRSRNGGAPPTIEIDKVDVAWTSGFAGLNRSTNSQVTGRSGGTNVSFNVTSQTPHNALIFVYGRNASGNLNDPTSSRLSFYSIGEAIDLALLDARVTALMNALAAAIP